jgi:hypothetical protein
MLIAVQTTIPAWWMLPDGTQPPAPDGYYPGTGDWFDAGVSLGTPYYPVLNPVRPIPVEGEF